MSGSIYEVRITRRAEKDIAILAPKLKKKLCEILMEVIARNPFEGKKRRGIWWGVIPTV